MHANLDHFVVWLCVSFALFIAIDMPCLFHTKILRSFLPGLAFIYMSVEKCYGIKNIC